MRRRTFVKTAVSAAAPLLSAPAQSTQDVTLRDQGYYITFMRQPTFGLRAWKDMINLFAEDGANTLILWIAGAFRSRRFPITWQWARDHENVRKDFVGQLISHAHDQGIKVLLGFTPFGYDGVNQLPLEKPDWKAVGSDGNPVRKFGIGCWGWNLCPAKSECQEFMRAYVREMAIEFYPEADGLFMESSDYAICHCPECGPRFFDHEFSFVQAVSEEMWSRKPDATMVIYPHYFSGARLTFSFGQAVGRQHRFDPRWTLFFTPHSAPVEPALISQARGAWWWNEAPSRLNIQGVYQGVHQAIEAGCTGYVPSLEGFSYVTRHAESGDPWIQGKRQSPFGFRWLQAAEHPYRELPVRAVRAAFRRALQFPQAPPAELDAHIAKDLFGKDWKEEDLVDLKQLLEVLNTDRDWSLPSALAAPDWVASRATSGTLPAETRQLLRRQLDWVRALTERRRAAPGQGDLHAIAQWLGDQWKPHHEAFLAEPPPSD